MGYDMATSIQSQSIPLILEGKDLIGKSQTGSGKTAAFGLPSIDLVDMSISPKTVQVLILCPTRELALQATSELKKFSKYKNDIKIVSIYGGEPIDRQMAQLRQGCQIVVGTPGRIMDHMRRKTLKLSHVKMVVLDEADEMLNMGFVEDIETILTDIPSEHQTIMFSATMPPAVLELTKKFQKDPVTVEIDQPQMTVSTIEQYYYNVPKGKKTAALCTLLEYYMPKSAIVFCNTKKMVDELVKDLRQYGFEANGLHGDMRQASRTLVMKQFREEQFTILVATDVAARGIDVNDIKIVVNYDLPMEDEYYVHRIGRTGRAGKSGQAFSLIQGRNQLSQLMNIMKYAKCSIVQKPLPTSAEIKQLRTDELCAKVSSFMQENDFSAYLPAVKSMAGERYTDADIAAALFAMSVKQNTLTEDISSDLSNNFEDDISEGSPRRLKKSSSRDPKPPKTPFNKEKYDDENMTSVRISIGRKMKISPNHILGAVAGSTGLPGKIFGAINIQNSYTTIDVPKEVRTLVVKSLNNQKIKGVTITVT